MAEPGRAERKLTVDFSSGDSRGGRVVGGDIEDGKGIVLGREQIQEILAAAKANGALQGEQPPQKELNIDLRAADAKAWSKSMPPPIQQPQPNGSRSSGSAPSSSGRLALGSPSALQLLPLLTLLLVAAAALYGWVTRAPAGSAVPPKKKGAKKGSKAAKED